MRHLGNSKLTIAIAAGALATAVLAALPFQSVADDTNQVATTNDHPVMAYEGHVLFPVQDGTTIEIARGRVTGKFSVEASDRNGRIVILPGRSSGYYPSLQRVGESAWESAVSALEDVGLSKIEADVVRQQIQVEIEQRNRMGNDIVLARYLLRDNVPDKTKPSGVVFRSLASYLGEDIATPSAIGFVEQTSVDEGGIMAYMLEGPKAGIWQGSLVWYDADGNVAAEGLIEVAADNAEEAVDAASRRLSVDMNLIDD